MYENVSGVEHHSAIVDVTDRCNLRCKHCFYYREERDSEDLDGAAFLAGLRTLRDRHKIQSMGWCGGEPLYRREVVEEGARLFPINQLYTNGTLPIPDAPGLMPFVSLDGTRAIHDDIRGRGCYDKVMANVLAAPVSQVVFTATFHRLNAACLEDLAGEIARIDRPRAALLILIFTPLREYQSVKGYKHTGVQERELDFTWEERDAFLDRVLALKQKYPGTIANATVNLQLMHSDTAPEATSRCNMPQRTLTLDVKLDRKLPCVLGSDVDCAKCGCPFPYEQEARRQGLKDKTFLELDVF